MLSKDILAEILMSGDIVTAGEDNLSLKHESFHSIITRCMLKMKGKNSIKKGVSCLIHLSSS